MGDNGKQLVENETILVGNGCIQESEPDQISIKEMLVRLGSVFPMDEAVIEGKPPFLIFDKKTTYTIHGPANSVSQSPTPRGQVHLRQKIRHQRLYNNWTHHHPRPRRSRAFLFPQGRIW